MPYLLLPVRSVFLLLLLAVLPPCAQAQAVRHFSTFDGLQANTVKAMVQDDDGYVWMGGTGGLNRFDGYRFTDFTRVGIDPYALTTRHIGQLSLDRTNRLLWTTTSTYSHGCLNLRTGRYEDYTGEGDQNRTFDKHLFTGTEMWLYNKGFGVRRIVCRDGQFAKTDYTRANGRLADDGVAGLAEDSRHHVWGIHRRGVFCIAPDGTCTAVASMDRPLAVRARGPWVCVVGSHNEVAVYRAGGRLLRKTRLPVAQGLIGEVTHALISRQTLYIFTPAETFALDLPTGTFARALCQVPGGVSQGAVADCQFVANRQSGILWLFPDHGAPHRLDLLPNIGPNADKGRIFNVVTDRQGRLVIASYGGGLFIYDPKDGTTRHLTAEDDDPPFYSNYLYALMTDATGCLWVAAESAGVSCIAPRQEATAQYVYPHPGLAADRSNYIRSVLATRDGIVLATNDNRLYRFDPATNRMTLAETVRAEVYAYLLDSRGREWRGTRGDGLYVDGVHYSAGDARHHVPVDDFYDIKEDRHGRVWLATWKGGLLCATGGKGRPLRFSQLLGKKYNASKIHDLELAPDGFLYIATYDGLYALDTRKAHITEKDLRVYHVDNGLLPANEIYCLKMARDGRLWVGCLGNGALECTLSADRRTLTYKAVTRDNGLANNNVLGITEDANHHLWMTTEQGVTELDHRRYARTFRFSKNILSNSYSENSGLLLPDGRLLFGTMNGLCIVSHADAARTGGVPTRQAEVTDLLVDGKSVFLLADRTDGATPGNGHTVTLGHDQNTITLHFSNFHYRDMASTVYQYCLEGVDNGWRPVTSASQADYSELRPGTYVFRLRAANNGVWSKPSAMTIVILRPWYATWWAWMVYLLVGGAVVYLLYRQWREKQQLRREMRLERQTHEYRQYRLADEILRTFRPEDYRDSRVAIVSGNDGERQEIEREMSGKLQTVALASGGAALEEMERCVPTLLICDERLADMSGYDLLARVKQNAATAALPVIMLTTLGDDRWDDDDDNRQMENYAAGADDFMAKPCNAHLLLARSIQLLSWNRQEMAEEKTADVAGAVAEETPAPVLSERDERFKRQLDMLMVQHLSDHDYTIDDLAAALKMGHTKFYGRVKEVTGQSPNKYLMDKRMATAAELLLDGQLTVSEISYKVGFLDQGYFNKCFKRQYGVPPSKYGK